MRASLGAAVLLLALSGVAMAQSSGDKKFLAKGSQGNLAEVELSKLALKKSTNPAVRSFAERMVQDHTELARKMSPFLTSAGIPPATSLNHEHQQLYSKLNGLSGTDFDRQFVTAMDKDHHEDLNEFGKEFSSTSMTALKVVVGQGRSVIEEHTRMVDDLSRQMGITPAGA